MSVYANEGFHTLAGFVKVVGAIDGSLVPIIELSNASVHPPHETVDILFQLCRTQWHVMPYEGGGSTLSTVSWGRWTLALLGSMIGTNEPSIAPTTLAKPANVYNPSLE